MNHSKEMAAIACRALEDKKGQEVTVIDISEMEKAGYHFTQREGYQTARWVLLDYKDIVVHVFSKEDRRFYDLERIWRDGKFVDVKELEG